METTDSDRSSPPPQGVRLRWDQIPAPVCARVEESLGSTVVRAISQPSGFSPGVAARLQLADGRRAFVKAVGPIPNPEAAHIHRREARAMRAMPAVAPVPPLLHFFDERERGWVVLLFADIEGHNPHDPWRKEELNRVLDAMVKLSATLTPAPQGLDFAGGAREAFATRLCGWQRLSDQEPSRLDMLDPWSLRHIDALAAWEQQAPAAVDGDTLLHFDLRADNILLTPDRVWFVDWPHICIGAAWIDVILFAPSVTMQGGPPPEDVAAQHPAYQAADPDKITAAIVAMAGFFTQRASQPPPPGLPTLRVFQAAQGIIARKWVAERTGWA